MAEVGNTGLGVERTVQLHLIAVASDSLAFDTSHLVTVQPGDHEENCLPVHHLQNDEKPWVQDPGVA